MAVILGSPGMSDESRVSAGDGQLTFLRVGLSPRSYSFHNVLR
jgi:hypothetical protein